MMSSGIRTWMWGEERWSGPENASADRTILNFISGLVDFNQRSKSSSGVEDQCLVTSLAANLWMDSSWLIRITAVGSQTTLQ